MSLVETTIELVGRRRLWQFNPWRPQSFWTRSCV